MNLSKLTLLTLTSVYLVQPTFADGIIGPAADLELAPVVSVVSIDPAGGIIGPAPDLELAPVVPIDDTWINIDPEGEITKFIIHSNTSITAFVIPDSQIYLSDDPFRDIGIECISTECDLGPTDFIYYKNSTTEGSFLTTAEARWTQSESDINPGNDDVIFSEKRVEFCQNNNYTTINARLSHRIDFKSRLALSPQIQNNYTKQFIFIPQKDTARVFNKSLPECTTAGSTALFSDSLQLHVPRAQLTIDGTHSNIWFKLDYMPTDDGKLHWVFDTDTNTEIGVNE